MVTGTRSLHTKSLKKIYIGPAMCERVRFVTVETLCAHVTSLQHMQPVDWLRLWTFAAIKRTCADAVELIFYDIGNNVVVWAVAHCSAFWQEGFSKPTIGLVMVGTLSWTLSLISDCPQDIMAHQVSIIHLGDTMTLQCHLPGDICSPWRHLVTTDTLSILIPYLDTLLRHCYLMTYSGLCWFDNYCNWSRYSLWNGQFVSFCCYT